MKVSFLPLKIMGCIQDLVFDVLETFSHILSVIKCPIKGAIFLVCRLITEFGASGFIAIGQQTSGSKQAVSVTPNTRG